MAHLNQIMDRFAYLDIAVSLSGNEHLREQALMMTHRLADAILCLPEGTTEKSRAEFDKHAMATFHPTSSGGEG